MLVFFVSFQIYRPSGDPRQEKGGNHALRKLAATAAAPKNPGARSLRIACATMIVKLHRVATRRRATWPGVHILIHASEVEDDQA